MKSPIRLVRNIDAGRLFDTFLLSSVLTVLIVRLYLHLSGYPQIGGNGLHIAHLLPGGLLMLAAILVMIGAINRTSRDFAAYLGGIGFGLFWDELGKFITQDNNYFFRPAASIMYVSFVALYMLTRYIIRRTYHPADYLANAIGLAMEGVIDELDPREYERARELLAKSDPAHPLYKTAAAFIEQAKPTKHVESFILARWATTFHAYFTSLVRRPRFAATIVTLFYIYGLGILAVVLGSLFLGKSLDHSVLPFIALGTQNNILALISSVASAAYIVWGAWYIQTGHTHRALQRFETALLINIFVTQVFLFFSYQFTAIAALAVALFLLAAVRMLLSETSRADTDT
jgi:hypothetical protein